MCVHQNGELGIGLNLVCLVIAGAIHQNFKIFSGKDGIHGIEVCELQYLPADRYQFKNLPSSDAKIISELSSRAQQHGSDFTHGCLDCPIGPAES